MSGESSVLGGLRHPEYTGENRCLPCTVVNLVLAIVASLLVSLIAVPLGVAAFAAALLAIYFRGYLVPGTPQFTKRYLPDTVLARFDHAEEHPAASEYPAATGSGETTDSDDGSAASDGDDPAAEQEWETLKKVERHRENEVDPEAFLRDAGAIETAENGDLVLTDDFRERLEERLEPLRRDDADDEGLAQLFGAAPADVERVERDHPALRIDARIRQWPSEAAFIADVATHQALHATTDDWLDVPLEQRVDVLESLRSFRETCPQCSGAVVGDESVVESCCRTFDVVTIACEDCDARLLELPAHAADEVSTPGGTLR